MDLVCNSQESFDNLLDNEVAYFDDANWVEVAWRREDISDVYQNGAGERRNDDGVESVEIENLSGPAELALEILPEEETTDVALMPTEKKVSRSNTQPHEAQIYRQSNDSGSLINPGHFRSSISRRPYKCDFGCDMPPFKCPKDLRRHINDIHETRTRYRCPIDGCKYSGTRAGHYIKRKDNFRRHLRNIHNMHGANFLDIDLGWFLAVV